MKKSVSIWVLLAILSAHFAYGQQTYLYKHVYFDTNVSDLSEEGMTTLDEVYETLKNEERFRLEILGHTDDQGAVSYNQALSERRANEVRDYLLIKGLKEDSIKLVQGFSENQPAVENDDSVGQAINRRVEVWAVYRIPKYVPPAPPTPEPPIVEDKTPDPPVEEEEEIVVTVPPIEETKPLEEEKTEEEPIEYITVTGDKGTKVVVPSNAFDPDAIEDVSFRIKEYFSVYDMVRNPQIHLHDDSDKCLESNGVVFVKASVGANKAIPAADAEIKIDIPMNVVDDQFKLYDYEKSDASWKESEVKLKQDRDMGTYSFTGSRLDGKTINKPYEDSKRGSEAPLLKVKGFGGAKWYLRGPTGDGKKPKGVRAVALSNDSKTSFTRYSKVSNSMFRNEEPCYCGGSKPLLVVLAYDKEGKEYHLEAPVKTMKYKAKKNMYIASKKKLIPKE